MVNNAGICVESSKPAPIDQSNEDIFDAHMQINVKGVYLGCKYALKQMKEQEPLASGDRGWIVNLASISAFVGMPGLRKKLFRLSFLSRLLTRCLDAEQRVSF